MRATVSFLVVLALTLAPAALEAQLGPCDDCRYDVQGEFAYCVIGGGGPFVDCFQQTPDFCDWGELCFEAEMVAVTPFGTITAATLRLGDASTLAVRSCDGSVVDRVYTRDEAEAIRVATWTISL